MPVRKFRSFEEAREALWGDPDDPAYRRQLAWLWALSSRLARFRYPRGVYRYATIEEAGRQREAWEAAATRESPD